MSKQISIAIDAMGGDDAPDKTIKGIKIFLDRNKSKNDFVLNIFGKEDLLINTLKKYNVNSNLIKIFKSNYVVSDEESPMSAVKNSKNTSMWNCLQHQADGKSDISLSAGNTGVLLVISRMILKMMDGVSKPALAGLWPNDKGLNVVLDLGANIDCNSKNLVDFSIMGASLYKSLYPNESPKIALLNIGSEEFKGNETIKETFQILNEKKNQNFDFSGYIEGNELMNGEVNVIISDGFTGNVALKTAEGTANFITEELKKALGGSLIGKISSLLNISNIKKFKKRLDPRLYNGAIFIGLDSPVVKSHGGTDYIGFSNSIDVCNRIVNGNLIKKIKDNII